MINFTYRNDTKLIFGENSIKNLEEEIKLYKNKSILILSSGDF